MKTRILSGLVMSIGIIALLTFGSALALHGLVVVLGTIAAMEYSAMAAPTRTTRAHLGYAAVALLLILEPLLSAQWHLSADLFWLVSFMLCALVHLGNPEPLETACNRLGRDCLGLIYLGVSLPYIVRLRGDSAPDAIISEAEGGWLLLLAILITAMSDTGGYFFGRAFGRRKLYPLVSPKKTMEGALGGILCAFLACWFASQYMPFMGNLTVMHCIVLALLGSTSAILGDLVESLLKRGYGVKDSGTLIPGHGGVLDRIDGLMFSAPFTYYFWKLVMP